MEPVAAEHSSTCVTNRNSFNLHVSFGGPTVIPFVHVWKLRLRERKLLPHVHHLNPGVLAPKSGSSISSLC